MSKSRRDKIPSEAQARRIALIWARREKCSAMTAPGAYVEPTTAVLIKNGWLKFNGNNITYPNGSPAAEYEVSADGLLALERFLILLRKTRSSRRGSQ